MDHSFWQRAKSFDLAAANLVFRVGCDASDHVGVTENSAAVLPHEIIIVSMMGNDRQYYQNQNCTYIIRTRRRCARVEGEVGSCTSSSAACSACRLFCGI